jgi:ribosomal protein L11 methyltransferase
VVRLPLGRAEEARAALIALFPAGFEEREEGDELELTAYGDQEAAERLSDALGPVAAEPVKPGWEERWKEFHRPVCIGPLWVGPPWERPAEGAVAVVIDPGRAFGTGAHPTTRLSLELLVGLEPGSLVDLGCGSGVLAIAAAKLGFAPVVALDVDEVAVETTRANAVANGVRVEVFVGDVVTDPLPTATVGVANILLPVVEAAASRLSTRLLVASGYLARDRPRLLKWRPLERRESEGWAADLLERLYD